MRFCAQHARPVAALLVHLMIASACQAPTPGEREGEGDGDGEAGVDPGCAAQMCEGDRRIASAADVAHAMGCTRIAGTLSVVAPTLTDLTGLECLEEIDGDLLIGADEPAEAQGASTLGPVQLTSLRGLARLRRIGGTLAIGGATYWSDGSAAVTAAGPVALASVDGLEAVRSVGALVIAAETEVYGAGAGAGVRGLVALADLSALDDATIGALTIAGTASSTLPAPPLASLPSVTLAEGADVTITDTALASLDGPAWPHALGGLTIVRNSGLTSIDALLDVTVAHAATVRRNISVAQCLVDERFAAWGLPLDADPDWDESRSTGNNSSCICDGASVVLCLPCVEVFVGAPIPRDARCVLGRVIVESSDRELDLPALEYAEALVIGQTGAATSLPALQRIRALTFQSFEPELPGSPTISLPALTRADSIRIEAYYPATTVDLSALETAGLLYVGCDSPEPPPLVPIAALDLSSIVHIDELDVRGCTELPRCALESDLEGASVAVLRDSGLDATCTCDASGDVVAGTCMP